MIQQLNLISSDEPQPLFGTPKPQELAELALEQIRNQPGITTEEIATRLGVSYQDMRFAIVRFLKRTGAVCDRGWEVVGHSCGTNEPNIEVNSCGTNKTDQKDSCGTNLRITWQKSAGTAKTDSKYPWLCDGDQHLIYIGGGNKSNPIAKARVEQIENWIEQGLPAGEIVNRIKLLKQGLWED